MLHAPGHGKPRLPLRIGHRGASADAPANSIEAIRLAQQIGADAVELDVQATADAVPILSHDDYLLDEQGRAWPIGAHTLAELRERIHPQPVVDVVDAIAVCRESRLAVYLDLRLSAGGPGARAALEQLVALAQESERMDDMIMASNRVGHIARIRELEPRLQRSILFDAISVDPVALAASCGAHFVHPCWEDHPAPATLLTPQWLGAVRAAGLGVITWHEERPAQLAALIALGVDGICTDRLGLINEVMAAAAGGES